MPDNKNATAVLAANITPAGSGTSATSPDASKTKRVSSTSSPAANSQNSKDLKQHPSKKEALKDNKFEEDDDVIFIEENESNKTQSKIAGKTKKSTEQDEIQFIGEFGRFRKSKRRVYMTIRNESIAAMRLTIRRSINSQFYYQMLVREVIKKHEHKATILRDPQFDLFSCVFDDIYHVELLYRENYQKRLNCQRKPHELFPRPKSLASLAKAVEEARQLALTSDSPSLKKYLVYFGQRKKASSRNRPSTSSGSNRHTPYGKHQLSLEELVVQLSQPMRYVNLTYSDESEGEIL